MSGPLDDLPCISPVFDPPEAVEPSNGTPGVLRVKVSCRVEGGSRAKSEASLDRREHGGSSPFACRGNPNGEERPLADVAAAGDCSAMGVSKLRRRFGVLVVTVAASALVGCASNSQPSLEREASRLLEPGTKLDEAEKALGGAAFTCGHYTIGYVANCTRLRNYLLIATCNQTINLVSNDNGQTVSRLDVLRPACASL